MEFRIEKDTMGDVKVPAEKYWGAQTERSRNNFKIGAAASMPLEVVYGFAYLKKAAAHANCQLGILDEEISCTKLLLIRTPYLKSWSPRFKSLKVEAMKDPLLDNESISALVTSIIQITLPPFIMY